MERLKDIEKIYHHTFSLTAHDPKLTTQTQKFKKFYKMYHLSRSLLHKNHILKPANHHVIKLYYSNLRMERMKDIEKLPEIEQLNKFVDNVKREIDVRSSFFKISFFEGLHALEDFTLYSC